MGPRSKSSRTACGLWAVGWMSPGYGFSHTGVKPCGRNVKNSGGSITWPLWQSCNLGEGHTQAFRSGLGLILHTVQPFGTFSGPLLSSWHRSKFCSTSTSTAIIQQTYFPLQFTLEFHRKASSKWGAVFLFLNDFRWYISAASFSHGLFQSLLLNIFIIQFFIFQSSLSRYNYLQ